MGRLPWWQAELRPSPGFLTKQHLASFRGQCQKRKRDKSLVFSLPNPRRDILSLLLCSLCEKQDSKSSLHFRGGGRMGLSRVRDYQRAVYRLQTSVQRAFGQVIQAISPNGELFPLPVWLPSQNRNILSRRQERGSIRLQKSIKLRRPRKLMKVTRFTRPLLKLVKARAQKHTSDYSTNCAESPSDMAFLSCHPYGSGVGGV